MKYIVEYGYPQAALEAKGIKHPCNVSGWLTCHTKKDAIHAANNLAFVLSHGQKNDSAFKHYKEGRATYWPHNRAFFVCISPLDGKQRGAYAATQDAK